MVFEILFLIGLIGFVAMALLGALQGGHHGGGHGHGHSVDAGHHGAIGHHSPVAHHGSHDASVGHHGGHGHSGAHGHAGHVGHHDLSIGEKALAGLPILLSPLTIFSVCLGMGATGLLLRKALSSPLLWFAAAAGGLLFFIGITRPLMNFIMSFASTPSEGLEGTVSKVAEATGNFDQTGRGVVKLTLDGEIVQLLAILDRSEQNKGVRVHRGEQVIVTEVDAQKGTCVVSRELGEGGYETLLS